MRDPSVCENHFEYSNIQDTVGNSKMKCFDIFEFYGDLKEFDLSIE